MRNMSDLNRENFRLFLAYQLNKHKMATSKSKKRQVTEVNFHKLQVFVEKRCFLASHMLCFLKVQGAVLYSTKADLKRTLLVCNILVFHYAYCRKGTTSSLIMPKY